jgi:hypoxanthine phosphoribosyltransferase
MPRDRSSRQRDPAGPRVPPPPAVLGARHRAELVVAESEVLAAIDRLSVRLALRLADANPWLLAVMHGALPFAGALTMRLNLPLELGYLHVERYRRGTRGGVLEWRSTPDYDLAGRTVLLVDDVLDRGETLAELVRWARAAGAREVLTVVLVDKQVDAERPVRADFAALECPDRYLFGWGMDYQGYWRNLPAIYALPDDLEGA